MKKTRLWWFVVSLGLVSLFADLTYEGARSILGPYFRILGGTAFMVGFTLGLGEFLGHGLRLLSGLWADKTRAYWHFTVGGYAINLLSIPAMALARSPYALAGLVLLERIGKALRTPARDVLLARASREKALGKIFGLHETLDQVGALLGPLFLWGLIHVYPYRVLFASLGFPAIVALGCLVLARKLEPPIPPEPKGKMLFPKAFPYAGLFVLMTMAGFAPFPLIAFHGKTLGFPDTLIPLSYAVAMGVDALVAYPVGHLFDRWGNRLLYGLPILHLGAGLALLWVPEKAFWGGIVCWGIAMGLQETLFKAWVACLYPEGKGTAFGFFHTLYGLGWLAGGSLLGLCLRYFPSGLLVWLLLTQGVAFFIFYRYRINMQSP